MARRGFIPVRPGRDPEDLVVARPALVLFPVLLAACENADQGEGFLNAATLDTIPRTYLLVIYDTFHPADIGIRRSMRSMNRWEKHVLEDVNVNVNNL